MEERGEFAEITEGKTRLVVPALSLSEKVPPKNPAFFNPAARLSRDLSVVAYNAFSDTLAGLKEKSFADAFAGVGSRALRVAVEVPAVEQVYLNDINPSAISLAKESAALNSVSEKCRFSTTEVCRFLSRGSDLETERFGIVDLDPFGTPARHLDCVLRSVIDGGMMSVTATDTAVLCGIYPQVCRRRYYGRPLNTGYGNEIALRLLMSLAALTASRLDLAIEPLFSHAAMHYLRIYARVHVSNSKANSVFENIGHVLHCFKCGNRFESKDNCTSKCPLCGERLAIGGRLWTGKIHDVEFAKRMLEQNPEKRSAKIIEASTKELGNVPFYFKVDEIAEKLKTNPPSVAAAVDKLISSGFSASVTSLNPTGIKTNARIDQILEVLR